MLVDVYLLREDGRKLTAEVHASMPLRGHLDVSSYRSGPLRSPDIPAVVTTARLAALPEQAGEPLALLEGKRLANSP